MKRYSYIALLLAAALALLFIDFYTKAYAYSFLPLTSSGLREIPLFHDVWGVDFSITLALNRGAAWGVFAHFQNVIVVIRILVIVAMLSYLFFVPHDQRREIPLILIVTGAFGKVVDFFRFNLWGYPFPIFNIADSLITIGVLFFFLLSFFQKRTARGAKE